MVLHLKDGREQAKSIGLECVSILVFFIARNYRLLAEALVN